MQRMDDNTYIDDSLVTCAEYQLFIDEMREQEKYYQPDHWVSYHFPEGQAHNLILGMRHSDAVAFCKWLTQREGADWQYRLPFQHEVVNSPIKLAEKGPIGYWLHELQFAWTNQPPKDARGISPRIVTHNILDRESNQNIAIRDTIRLASNRPLDFEFNINLLREFNRKYMLDLDVAIEPASTVNVYERDRLAKSLNAFSRKRAQELDQARRLDLELNLALQGIRIRVLDLNDAAILALVDEFEKRKNINYHLFYDVYVDLFTLQERIAGRSPAFEGIRLVKERIR